MTLALLTLTSLFTIVIVAGWVCDHTPLGRIVDRFLAGNGVDA